MEVVKHIHIVEICGRRLVCDIDGMQKRNIPNRESLEFRISRLNAAAVFVVYLREADSHLSAARTGGGHNNKLALSFDKIILTEALF